MILLNGRFILTTALLVATITLFMTAPARGAIGIDVTTSTNQGSATNTVSTPAFSTLSGNELLLAFISVDNIGSPNTTVTNVAGGGLTWVLIERTNVQEGTAEIWRAFAPSALSGVTVTATLSKKMDSSITVMSFSGVNASGTNGSGAIGAVGTGNADPGAPTATLVTTGSGSLVLGVGNDWDNGIARTPGTGQTVVHQYLPPVGDTYWVQMQSSPILLTGTTVTINDTAPTGDRYNLSIVEVLAAAGSSTTGTISGTISPAASGNGATVTLSQSGTTVATTIVGTSGTYTFNNVTNGTYTVTPSETGFTFTPGSQSATVNGNAVTVPVFTATALSGGISGAISPAASGNGATVTLSQSGTTVATTVVGTSGTYAFNNVTNGTYTVTPSETGFAFTPGSQSATVNGNAVTVPVFTATALSGSISGAISPAANGNGATVTLSQSGTTVATTIVGTAGTYTFNNVTNGTYTVTPTETGFVFSPASTMVTVDGAAVTGINFNTVVSVSGTISGAGGNGATLTLSSGGVTSATTTANATGAYSFNNVSNGSYTVTPSNNGFTFTPPSQSVTVNNSALTGINFTSAVSTTSALVTDTIVSADKSTSTVIASPSFSTTSGNELLLAFIATDFSGSGTNTTVNNVTGAGLTWALVERTNKQMGTSEIWRAFASTPLTNVSVSATLSNSVMASMTVVTFAGVDTSGVNGSGAIGATGSANAASGGPTASLVTTRNTSWVFGVGNDWDNAIARTPGANQSLVHEFLSPSGDTYWVQKQNATTPLSGTTVTMNDTAPTGDRYNLSIVEVLPSQSGGGGTGTGTPPTVSITFPAPNSTVANMTTVAANAADPGYVISGVQFLLDGSNLGAEVTSPPYSITWDTTTVVAGTHTLSATAYNTLGLSTTSSPVTVTVDNSGNLAVVGSWSAPVDIPTVAVNLTLLKNNTLLFYEDGSSPTTWDYVNNIFTSVPAPADLFCSGQTALADGRILMVGGYGQSSSNMGIANAEIFDPTTNAWTTVPKMAYPRWYPTATTLSDGRVLVTGGWKTTEHTNAGIPEIYDPVANTWTSLTNANNPFESYPFIYMLSDGRLVHVNGSEYPTVTDILNLTTQSWSVVDPNIKDGGSSAMYLPDKIMKAGSASDSQGTGPSSNTTFVLDMTQSSPAWTQTPSMAYPRTFLNLTMLPDGTVLATGGETDKNGGNISNAVYPAELWSPATQTWTTMASMHTPREYHSTAVLLPDGRVVESGMGADFGNVPNEMSAEFYSPPYLFKGARPTITQAPTQISYGQNFTVATPDAATIVSAVLIRTGSATHFFDMSTHFVPVVFQQTTGGLTVTAPANAYQAPPGYYMLFIVNASGVPSIAPFVQLQ